VQKEISNPQRLINGNVHNWYRTILGFSDHVVAKLIERFELKPGQQILDPFCGTGTTLVESMKLGIDCSGIDANPVGVFATRVKTNWSLRPNRLRTCTEQVADVYPRELEAADHRRDPTYLYLESSGMLDRGWISRRPLQKALAIKRAIKGLSMTRPYRDALMLALVAEVVRTASNVKFGPELYCGPRKGDSAVLGAFLARAESMASDLELVANQEWPRVSVRRGDARRCDQVLRQAALFDAIISSPPYPSEHDYTRNTRLELAFIEAVANLEGLRLIKKTMIRSHTKGIYKEDNDADWLTAISVIDGIVHTLRRKVRTKTYGFARLYPRIVQEYFGGMKRHLESAHATLRQGAKCGYIVGDQSSYLQVHIPTADILATIAESVGFRVVGIELLRGRWATATSKTVNENILIIEKKSKKR
jgi:DNA methylase